MKGVVIKNTGSWYTVHTEAGSQVQCKVKGNFRLRGIRSTNPVAVGDEVEIDVNKEGTAFITDIGERRNYIVRKSPNLSKQSHIIAANVDQAVLVVTVNHPQTATTFIDRFLASAEAYSVPVVLAFNKTDLLNDEERHIQQLMMSLYDTIGYQCVAISAATGEGVDTLRDMLEGKVSVLSGNSGVGKSTLINTLVPGLQLRTSQISDAHNTGTHTTTFSEMIALPQINGQEHQSPITNSPTHTPSPREGRPEHHSLITSYIIDTPGIKGFGTFDMEPEELTSYFKEIFRYSHDCRFSNCTHTHEPGCAVIKALDDKLIAPSRYMSYLSMLEDKNQSKYREAH